MFHRVTEVIGELRAMLSETPPSTPDWLYIPEDAVPALLDILNNWDPWPSSRTAEHIIAISHYQPGPDDADENQSRMPRLGTFSKLQRQIKQKSVERLHDISTSKVFQTDLPPICKTRIADSVYDVPARISQPRTRGDLHATAFS